MESRDMHDELTPEERAAFAGLPRERDPGAFLEERTVRALRGGGLLQPPSAGRVRRRAPWIAAAAAAAAAFFLGGMAVGQQMGSRATAELFAASSARSAEQVALLVQETGSAYVGALARLAELTDTIAGGPADQGREAAARLLQAAADEMVRIAPDDALASGILAAYPAAEPADTAAAQPRRNVIWF